jgi:hypothetical protein
MTGLFAAAGENDPTEIRKALSHLSALATPVAQNLDKPRSPIVPFPTNTPVNPSTTMAGRNLASSNGTALPRMLALSESWHDEPGVVLPDSVRSDLAECLPAAIEAARQALEPGDPAEVLTALKTLADRKGFNLPPGIGLDLDIEVMSEWPRDLFRRAFRGIWENFAYRRMPEVGDFRAFIGDALGERRNRLAKLESMRLRLKTLELREQWDTQSRERRARRETVKSMVVEDVMARRKRVDPTLHQAQNPPHS